MKDQMVYDPVFVFTELRRIGLVVKESHGVCIVVFEDGSTHKFFKELLELVPRLHGINKNGNIHVTQ